MRILAKDWTDEDWTRHGITDPRKPSNISIVIDMLAQTKDVPGDVAECGVFQGASLAAMAAQLQALGSRKRLWAFDSFEGLPEAVPQDKASGQLHPKAARGTFSNTSLDVVRGKLAQIAYEGEVKIVVGWFERTLAQAPGPFSLVFLDCDMYESYRTCLAHFWPRLSKGGVVVFDENQSVKFPGARLAVDEFFADKQDKPAHAREYLKNGGFERWYARKT